ncbi:helix-turn-helix domain-containing protein [Finegoldia sp. P1-F-LR]
MKLLIDKNMCRKDLQELAGISAASIAKLAKGRKITTDVLLKICEALNCNVEDIIETIEEEEK